MQSARIRKFLSFLSLAAIMAASPAYAVSLKGTAADVNEPAASLRNTNSVAITDGGNGKFALLWAESIDIDTPTDQADRLWFRAYSETGHTALGKATSLAGTTNVAPFAIGIHRASSGKYRAVWGDRVNGDTNPGIPVYSREFDGPRPTGMARPVRSDRGAFVSETYFVSRHDGTSLLIDIWGSSNTPRTYAIDATNKVATSSVDLPSYLPDSAIGFDAIGPSSIIATYNTVFKYGVRVFSNQLKLVGKYVQLPIKTTLSNVEQTTQLGTRAGNVYSLYSVRSGTGVNGLYARFSDSKLGGSTSYKIILSGIDSKSIVADDLPNGDLLIAYTTSNKSQIKVTRFNSKLSKVGATATINRGSAKIMALQALSNGDAVIVYRTSAGKAIVQRLGT